MIYQSFAALYDELFDEDLYANWADYVCDRVQPGRLLDLAGGAGRLAVRLAHAGFTVTDLDKSEEMLTLAANHAAAADVAVELLEGDLLDLEGLPQYPTITCFADSLCYLPDLEAVTAAFKQVAAHLEAGGTFLFDVITPYQTDQVYPGYRYCDEDPDRQRAFLWQSFADDGVPHGVTHDLAFYTRQESGDYRRVGEVHHERTYQLAEYQQALTRAGFNWVTVTADFGHARPSETTTRWFFTCRREAD